MNREQIEQLVRMAGEIEALESSALDGQEPILAHAAQVDHPPLSDDEAEMLAPIGIAQGAERVREAQRQRDALDRSYRAHLSRKSKFIAVAAVTLLGAFAWQSISPILQPSHNPVGPVAIKPNLGSLTGGDLSETRLSEGQRRAASSSDEGATNPTTSTVDHRVGSVNPPRTIAARGGSTSLRGGAIESDRGASLASFAHDTCDPRHDSVVPASVHPFTRILLVAMDESGDCGCRQTVLHQWPGDRRLDSISRSELLELGFESSCISSPSRLMVVAISGNGPEVLNTDAEAMMQLASCVDDVPEDDEIGYLGRDEVRYAAAAAQCLTSGLSIQVATLLAR